jgi:hypothetical protein
MIKRSRPIADELYFPMPPARIDRTLDEMPLLPAVAATYLSAIQRWRESVLTAIVAGDTSNPDLARLSPRARAHLALLLDTRWDTRTRLWALGSAYHLTRFPESREPTPTGDPMARVLAALRWRAGVVTYLADVWDVIGRPALSREECEAIGALFRPPRMDCRCVLCLSEYDPGRVVPDDHDCVMLSYAGAW